MLLTVDGTQRIVGQRIVGASWATHLPLARRSKGQLAKPLGRLVDEENVGR